MAVALRKNSFGILLKGMICNYLNTRHMQFSWETSEVFLMGQPRPLFNLFLVFFQQTIQFLQQINVKKWNVHPAYGAESRTHSLLELSCLPFVGSVKEERFFRTLKHFKNTIILQNTKSKRTFTLFTRDYVKSSRDIFQAIFTEW